MLKTRNVKRIIAIILIIGLIYANLNTAVLGLISYALDEQETKTEEANEKQKELEIKVSDIAKNKMQEEVTEYEESMNLKLKYEEIFKKIIIADEATSILEKNSEEEPSNEEEEESNNKQANIFYKSTKLSKTELMNAIGENGNLEIKYNTLELEEKTQEDAKQNEENKNENMVEPQENIEENNENVEEVPEVEENEKIEEVTELPEEEKIEEPKEGEIKAENGTVVINKDTIADEENNITIVYPENTNSVEIEILAETNKIETLNIVHRKTIEKLENIENVEALHVVKQIIVNGEEKELLNTKETLTQKIEYTKTIAELGIDKAQISAEVANKVNFTITLHTDKTIYDLYKNPHFVIELPKTVKTFNAETLTILNNPYFTVQSVETGTLENGNKAISIKLEGEQTEYNKSIEENTQIIFETTLEANELIPTTEETVKLHYQNENVKTYDGVGIQETGITEAPLTFVANKEVIVQTQAIAGEQVVSSPRTDYKTVVVKPHTYQNITITGMAINNTGVTIENAKILGTATNVGPISGIDAKIYYTQNENATIDLNNPENAWSLEYVQNARKYLIIVENFAQAQGIFFQYNMNLLENIETDVKHEVQFEVYDDNNQVINTSKTTIYQEAEKLDTYVDEKIKAEMVISEGETLEIGDYRDCLITITNTSGEEIENLAVAIEMPEIFRVVEKSLETGSTEKINCTTENRTIKSSAVNLSKDETLTIKVRVEVIECKDEVETIKANISYGNEQKEISNKLNIVKPSQIKTTITSDKESKTLEANEEIIYTVTLQNVGKSHAEVNVSIPDLENIDIVRVDALNKATGVESSISATHLAGEVLSETIAPEEVIVVTIKGIAKEVQKDSISSMYAEVEGDKIQNTITNKISNTVKKTQETNVVEENTQRKTNIIEGTAWIDQNENGQKDKGETLLKGVQAVLVNTKTSKAVATQFTNNEGEYSFQDVENGSYIVEFKYNKNNLNVTEYKNERVPENLDSDVISATQNNKTTAKTGVIKLEEGTLESVNAGFVVNKNFDMSISKGISKVTVNNEQGINTYPFNNSSMAKVEIDGEYLKGSVMLIEYEIAVTNTSEVEGYAKLISDKIPEGMKFSAELNKEWYEGNDGKIYSVALANKELQPGETAVIKLVLTKEMKDDKVTITENTAKIEETYNKYLAQDKKQENNVAVATLIISLTTGSTQNYIYLALAVLAIIAIGTFGAIKIMRNKKIQ